LLKVLRNLFILLSFLPLPALMASQAEFTQCSDFGCKTRIELDLSMQQWSAIHQIFAPPAATALQEKFQIRQAIALMEQFTGEITGSSMDKAENYPGDDLPHQQDCIDESTNTFQYLFALQKRGWLKWHKVAGKQRRIVWLASHWTALIEDITDHQIYAVDSWYRDNGEPPYIQKLEDWKVKKSFPVTLNP
jgi:hypothetical protein